MPFETATTHVLHHFPIATSDPPHPLAHLGTSGARIWRVTGFNGPLCLRAWPVATTGDHLSFVHRMMTKVRALVFVPKVCQAHAGATWIEHAGRLWDLTTWMPGAADFAAHPSLQRLENACTGLAQLHVAWQSRDDDRQPCSAVHRRLVRVRVWSDFVAGGWQPPAATDRQTQLESLVVRAWRVLPPLMREIPRQLAPWSKFIASHQSCHGDLWHDNILFTGDSMTGIVDYAGIRRDHIAVDLARLLGSLVLDNQSLTAAGLAAYRAVHPLSEAEVELVRVLDTTGTVIAAANWLLWLFWEKLPIDNIEVATRRLDLLLRRLEQF